MIFEISKAVIVKNTTVGGVVPCSSVDVTDVSEQQVAFIFRVAE
jgi:hypothetical protein